MDREEKDANTRALTASAPAPNFSSTAPAEADRTDVCEAKTPISAMICIFIRFICGRASSW